MENSGTVDELLAIIQQTAKPGMSEEEVNEMVRALLSAVTEGYSKLAQSFPIADYMRKYGKNWEGPYVGEVLKAHVEEGGTACEGGVCDECGRDFGRFYSPVTCANFGISTMYNSVVADNTPTLISNNHYTIGSRLVCWRQIRPMVYLVDGRSGGVEIDVNYRYVEGKPTLSEEPLLDEMHDVDWWHGQLMHPIVLPPTGRDVSLDACCETVAVLKETTAAGRDFADVLGDTVFSSDEADLTKLALATADVVRGARPMLSSGQFQIRPGITSCRAAGEVVSDAADALLVRRRPPYASAVKAVLADRTWAPHDVGEEEGQGFYEDYGAMDLDDGGLPLYDPTLDRHRWKFDYGADRDATFPELFRRLVPGEEWYSPSFGVAGLEVRRLDGRFADYMGRCGIYRWYDPKVLASKAVTGDAWFKRMVVLGRQYAKAAAARCCLGAGHTSQGFNDWFTTDFSKRALRQKFEGSGFLDFVEAVQQLSLDQLFFAVIGATVYAGISVEKLFITLHSGYAEMCDAAHRAAIDVHELLKLRGSVHEWLVSADGADPSGMLILTGKITCDLLLSHTLVRRGALLTGLEARVAQMREERVGAMSTEVGYADNPDRHSRFCINVTFQLFFPLMDGITPVFLSRLVGSTFHDDDDAEGVW